MDVFSGNVLAFSMQIENQWQTTVNLIWIFNELKLNLCKFVVIGKGFLALYASFGFFFEIWIELMEGIPLNALLMNYS